MSQWEYFRVWLGMKLLGDVDSPLLQRQRRKTEIYKALHGMKVGDSLDLLIEIFLESTPSEVDISSIQKQTPALEAIGSRLRFSDFMYLLASAIHHELKANITPRLTEPDRME